MSCTQKIHITNNLKVEVSRPVLSVFLQPHGWQPTRLLCRCDSPGKNTEWVARPFLQGILPPCTCTDCTRVLTLRWRKTVPKMCTHSAESRLPLDHQHMRFLVQFILGFHKPSNHSVFRCYTQLLDTLQHEGPELSESHERVITSNHTLLDTGPSKAV